jgi:PfaB family protein
MMILDKVSMELEKISTPLLQQGLIMLPIGFEDLAEGLRNLKAIRHTLSSQHSLYEIMKETINQERRASKYALILMGSTSEEITGEIDRALDGLAGALDSGRDWQTPTGSYFTPDPMGPDEKIAFVYPGAFGTYVGMGREIFDLFPQLHEAMEILTDDPDRAINADVIFPTNKNEMEIQALQARLDRSPTMMISSGICFSYLYTVILQEIFQVKPGAAFGYSLGENSMMFATGIWTQADAMRTSLETSPIFHERVSGKQKAIREYWGIREDGNGDSIWSNYVLMAPYEKVMEAIQPGDKVYLTHINTPRQVVIGGEDEACRRVADTIKCMHLKAPYNHAIHCPPVESEIDDFVRLHDWPVENEPDIPIYSAAGYEPLNLTSREIAESFARMLTHPIDFPRLVNRAYDDGARIFIELGAGSNCSKWIDAILKDKRHTSTTINQVNMDDHVSILKLLAKLISHRVSLDLTVLTA